MIDFVKGWQVIVYEVVDNEHISPSTAYTNKQDALNAKEIMLEDGMLQEYGHDVKIEEIYIGISPPHTRESVPDEELPG